MRPHVAITGGFLLTLGVAVLLWGQERPAEGKTAEEEIRRLYDLEHENLVRMDIEAQGEFLPDDFVCTNPFNLFIDKSTVMERMKADIIKYTAYDREYDYFRRYGDTMVVVGSETVVPALDAKLPYKGKINRRFTEMWVRRDGTWQKVVRHASNLSGVSPGGQGDLEQQIREIDRAEAAAVLADDLPAIEKFWAEDLTVNAPNNQILKGTKDAIELVKNGILDYASFNRNVEAVLIHRDMAILMGQEMVKPQGKAPLAGQTVHRRFTNIWMKRNGQWQLTARQATIIDRDVVDQAKDEAAINQAEAEIHALDEMQARAWVARDQTALERLWSPQFVLNAPSNQIFTREGVFCEMRTPRLRESVPMERTVERVTPFGDIMISMGVERHGPKDGPAADSVRTQRYTNVWRREGDTWRMIGRHAHVLQLDPSEPPASSNPSP